MSAFIYGLMVGMMLNTYALMIVAHFRPNWLGYPEQNTGEGAAVKIPVRIDIDHTDLSRHAHPEAICARCGGTNPTWTAPSPLWNEVMRGGDINGSELYGGIVCPSCFANLAEESGAASGWRLVPLTVYADVKLVTPSGRVWNEATWLWEEQNTESNHD